MQRRQISARFVAFMAISVLVVTLVAVGSTILVLRERLNDTFATASADRWVATATETLMDRADPRSLRLTDAEERALLNALSPGGIVDYRLLDPDGRVVRSNRAETLGAVMAPALLDQLRTAQSMSFLIDPLRNRPLQDGQAEAYASLRLGNETLGFVGIRLNRVEAGQDIFRFAEIGFIVFALVLIAVAGPAIMVLYRHLDARAILERDLNQRTNDLMRAEQIANVGHWMLKRETDMYEWSPEMYRIFGVDPETFKPSAAAVLARYHPKDREKASKAGLEAIRTGQSVRQEIRIKRPNGELRYTENFIDCIFDEKGLGVGYFGVTRDVTDRVLQEMELREARDGLQAQANELTSMAHDLKSAIEKSDRANAAKGDFLAMMSHELRTPMTGILGMADLIRLSGLSPQQEELAENLIVSARSLLDLLNDILDFSKIEAGKIEIEHVHFSLHRLVLALKRLFEPAITEKGNQLKVEIAADAVDMVVGDPKRVNQILANLVSNANKFTDQGQIAISVSSKALPDDTHRIEIRVRDTGIGMSESDQQNLFQPFTQADTSTSRRYGGTGLGLSISKRLLDAMHGEITVDSVKGKGSTFTIRLAVPAGDAAKAVDRSLAAAPPLAAASQSSRALRILIAEDNDINRTLFEKMLTRLGHSVVTAINGQDAVSSAEAADFDVILMDIQMPIMDGLTATRRLRDEGGVFAKLPIIGLTADAMTSHHESYLAAGMNAIVTKPVDWQALSATMLQFAGENAATSETANAAPLPLAGLADTAEMELHTINEMLSILPRATVSDLFETFLNQMDVYVADINAAVDTGDLGKIKSAAHTLRGISAQFGTVDIAAVARAMEEKSESIAEARVLAEALTDSAARTKTVGQSVLTRLKASL